MTTITRNQAICMFYGEEYTDENVARLSKRLDEVEVDICYLDDPTEPILSGSNTTTHSLRSESQSIQKRNTIKPNKRRRSKNNKRMNHENSNNTYGDKTHNAVNLTQEIVADTNNFRRSKRLRRN
ncbi:hypothetical protein CU098_003868 [Rhizopus stolonifer]|uniref:Uncharacterized protein n=1 Tax=Rhizopus stolonifer TaxID=4846 RepID=A0A367IKF8_RHIST|nr:hypothetical protein CU098_003868 [Rhizopus stolonifer]